MTAASIALEEVSNFRDLGGHRSETGRVVASGLVFRSGHLAHPTAQDTTTLARLGIRTVVDLRSTFGLTTFGPDRLPPSVRLVSLPISLVGENPSMVRAMEAGSFARLPDLAAVNRMLVREHAEDFGRLLALIADGERLPLLFHCIGGKDRTGVAAALLLSVLGVPWPIVRDDYLASNAHFLATVDGHLAEWASRSGEDPDSLDLEAARRFFIVEGAYIDAVRDEILSVSDSIEEFATETMNVPPEAVQRLRDGLLVDQEASDT